MPSTYTLNNGIELIGTGEQSGTWGDTTNTNLELLDTALDGQVTITATSAGSSSSPNDLPISDGSASNGRNRMVIITSATDLGADVYYQLTPNDAEKIIYVRNDLNAQDLILFQGTYNASNDYVVPNGKTAIIFFDGAGSGAVAANVFNNAHFDNLNIVGDVTIGDDLTLNSDGAIINIGADSDLQITHSGTAGTIRNDTGNLTLDVAGDLALDAAGGDFNYKIGGTEILRVSNASLNTDIFQVQSDTDIRFKGNDGGSTITALTLDMSAAGAATFNAGGVFNESGADSDFRVESDTNTHALFVDAGNSRVAVGTSSVSDDFTVRNRFNVSENDGGSEVTLAGVTNRSASLFFKEGSTQRGRITGVSGSNTLTFQAGTSERLRMNDTEVVFNDASADIDFRVESNTDQYAFYVDGGHGGVQMGGSSDFTSDIGAAADGRLGLVNTGNGHAGVSMFRSDTSIGGGNVLGQISAYNNDTTSNTITELARIEMAADGTFNAGDNPTKLVFYTTEDATDTVREVGKFDNRGTFKVNRGAVFNDDGSDADTADFRVESDTNTHALFLDAGNDYVGLGASNLSEKLYLTFQTNNASSLTTGGDNTENAGGMKIINTFTGTNSFAGLMLRANDADTKIVNLYDGTSNGSDFRIYVDTSPGGGLVNRFQMNQAGTVINQDGGDFDFRIETDNQENHFFLDSTNERVGFFTGTPVVDVDATKTDDTMIMRLRSNNAAPQEVALELVRGTTSTFGGDAFNDYKLSNDSGNFVLYSGHSSTTQDLFRTVPSSGSVFNEGGESAVDFRVESNNSTHAFFVDAGTDKIGFSEDSPVDFVQISFNDDNSSGRNSLGSQGDTGLKIENKNNTVGSFAGIFLRGYDNDFKITAGYSGTTNGCDVDFYADTSAGGGTSRMYFGSSATVFNNGGEDIDFRVESNGSSAALFVNGGTDQVLIKATSMTAGGNGINSPLVINAPSGQYNGLTFGTGYQRATIAEEGYDLILTANAYPAYTSAKDAVIIKAGNSGGGGPDENLRVDQDGIKFNGDTAQSNALNDYEEGSWTPNLQGASVAGTTTYGSREGWYRKVGDIVTAQCIVYSTSFTGSGLAEITGLPYACNQESVGESQTNAHSSAYDSKLCNVSSIIQNGETKIHMRGTFYDTTAGPYYVQMQNFTYLRITITYKTSGN